MLTSAAGRVTLVLCAGAALALALPKGRPSLGSLPTVGAGMEAQGPSVCKDHFGHGARMDTVKKSKEFDHSLYRNENWSTLSVDSGAWIGEVRNEGNGKSGYYPDLNGHQTGCIYFRRIPTGASNEYADVAFLHVIWPHKVKTVPLPHVLFCHLPSGTDNDVPPEFKDWPSHPGGCDSVSYSGPEGAVTFAVPPTVRGLTDAAYQAAMTEELRKHVPDLLIGSGPWFPCDQAGCCRAY